MKAFCFSLLDMKIHYTILFIRFDKYHNSVLGTTSINEENIMQSGEGDEMELPLFDLVAIEEATNNFSNENKLGEGGFGSVYKVKIYY